MPKRKSVDYGPFQPITENYSSFIKACTQSAPFRWARRDTPASVEKLQDTTFLVIDFDVRPQRRVFEENFLQKFKYQPFWELVAERAVAKTVKLIFKNGHKNICWEANQSDVGYHGTIVLLSENQQVYETVDMLSRMLYSAKKTCTWTKKALKYETGNPDGIAITVRGPTSKIVFPMVAENFLLSNGFAPTWNAYNWRTLAAHLKSEKRGLESHT